MEVAAGLTTHSGWAVAVVVGLAEGQLQLLDRRRVELIEPGLPRQAYHAAAELPLDEARSLVAAVDASIERHAVDVLTALQPSPDHRLTAVGIVGRPREIPDVETVLANHSLMHACEGEQYRRGVADAARRLDLQTTRTDAKALNGEIERVLGWPPSRLTEELNRIRSSLGPPWQRDHKDAATAGLLAL